jgi:predicted phosphoribosyltransferase
MEQQRRFRDRRQAGRELASHLIAFRRRADVVVLGLPRGGVPVAFEVAQFLEAPLDVFVVRKLGLPAQPELAMGAIASGGFRVLNESVLQASAVPPHVIDSVARSEQSELERRERSYRGERPLLQVRDRTVLLVDDGLATGATMRVAARALRSLAPLRLVVAVPVGARDTCAALTREADEVICAIAAHAFHAVGQFYEEFGQIPDAEVRELLERAAQPRSPATPGL